MNQRTYKQLARAVHVIEHLLDDHAEESGDTGTVTIELDREQWVKINKALDAIDHDKLHDILGIG